MQLSYYRTKIERIIHNLLAKVAFSLGFHEKLYLGVFKTLPTPFPKRPLNVLFLCTGNICRSPYASEVFSQRLPEELSQKVRSASAGLLTSAGKPADPTMVKVAQAKGFDLTKHLTQKATEELVSHSDILIIMEPLHLRLVKKQFPGQEHKCLYLGSFSVKRKQPLIVDDPFGKPSAVAVQTASHIDSGIQSLINKISSVFNSSNVEPSN